MLSSILMTTALAAAVMASPLQHFDKRAMVTVYANPVTETDIVATTTVYDLPASGAAQTGNKDAANSAAAPQVQNNWHGNGNGNGQGGWGGHGGRPYSSHSQAKQVVTSSYQAPPPPATTSSTPKAKPSSTKAPSPTNDNPPAAPTSYQDIAVFHHNLHRANHSVPDVSWSDDLASIAQQIAESCNYKHNTEAGGGGYGQNIAAGVEASNISAIITELFYNGEEPLYTAQYGQANPDMSNFEKWGHFTQIVWKETSQVGCYTQYCPGGLANVGTGVSPYFTVCNYKGPGNYAGEYSANVLKPKGQSSAHWNTGM